MARPLRIERAGGWYHCTARGNERRSIYRDDRDRRHFCELLAEMVAQFNVVLHAFVLMDNHFHLVIELREANLSRAMQWLNVSYSVWFNRRHGRAGHLFQGRYRSVIVEPAAWALALTRYVHLNPVRTEALGLSKTSQQQIRIGAGGVPDAAQVKERTARLRRYRWSSYRAYIGLAKAPAWLDCDTVLNLGGGPPGEERRRYREYVEAALREGLAQTPWEELKERLVLGSQEFVAGLRAGLAEEDPARQEVRRLREQRPAVSQVIQCVEALKGEPWQTFRDRCGDSGRDLVLYAARKACGLSWVELARATEVGAWAAAAMGARRFEARRKAGGSAAEDYRKVVEMLNVKMRPQGG